MRGSAYRRFPIPGRCSRGHGDDGSLIAELALISPLLVVMLLGVFEFGMGWREATNNSGATRAAARSVTNVGSQRSADWSALTTFTTNVARSKNIKVNRVVIYKTAAADGDPTDPTCLTTVPPSGGTGKSGACNIYSEAQLNSLDSNYLTHFGTSDTACATSAWDHYWCPLSRKSNQGDPPDYVGVYANFTYTSWTGLLPTTITMTERVVMRIEPKVT
jgi:hypothetical protein